MTPNENSQVIAGPDGLELAVSGGLVPPSSTQCEEWLLSAVLLDESGQAWAVAQACGVKAKAFTHGGHFAAWTAICELRRRGEPVVDVAVVAEELALRGELEKWGGYAWVTELSRHVATTLHVRFFAETLVYLWQLRHALTLAQRLREAALAGESREAFAGVAGDIGQRLIRLGRREATQTLAQAYDSVSEEARMRVEGTMDRSRWVTSSLPKFDRTCKELGSRRTDHYTILAAGSGDGKTTALCQIGAANLEVGKSVLMYSREVDIAGFIEKMVSARTAIDLNRLEDLPKPDAERFYAECARQRDLWADKRLWVVQQEPATPIYTVEDVVEHARAHVHLHGVPTLIMVDYLQIFDTRKRVGGQNREAVVAHVTHTLQALQRELGCVMIVAAQLNETGLREMREVKRDENGKVKHRMPNRGDLRESQAAYHDADRFIFLYRPPVDFDDVEQHAPGLTNIEVWWYQEKRRGGGCGIVRCRFEKKYARFVECDSESRKQPVEDVVVSKVGIARGTMEDF